MKRKDPHPKFVVEIIPKKNMPKDLEAELNIWYEKHFELMLNVPGIIGAERYCTPTGSKNYLGTSTEGEKKYLAFYEIVDTDSIDKTLSSEERRVALQDPGFGKFTDYIEVKRYVYLPIYGVRKANEQP